MVPTIKALGCTTYQIDQYLLVTYAEQMDKAEVEKARKWFELLLGDRLLYDGRILTPETLEGQIRVYLAMERINKEESFDFCGLRASESLPSTTLLAMCPRCS